MTLRKCVVRCSEYIPGIYTPWDISYWCFKWMVHMCGSQSVATMIIDGSRRFDLENSWETLMYWRKRKRSTGSLLCLDVLWNLITELSWREIPLNNSPVKNTIEKLQGFYEPNNLYILENILTILGLLPAINPLMIWYRNPVTGRIMTCWPSMLGEECAMRSTLGAWRR